MLCQCSVSQALGLISPPWTRPLGLGTTGTRLTLARRQGRYLRYKRPSSRDGAPGPPSASAHTPSQVFGCGKRRVISNHSRPPPLTSVHSTPPGTFSGASVFLLLITPTQPVSSKLCFAATAVVRWPHGHAEGRSPPLSLLQVSDRPSLRRQASPEGTPCFSQPTPSTMLNRPCLKNTAKSGLVCV